jgi:hypothetical protein
MVYGCPELRLDTGFKVDVPSDKSFQPHTKYFTLMQHSRRASLSFYCRSFSANLVKLSRLSILITYPQQTRRLIFLYLQIPTLNNAKWSPLNRNLKNLLKMPPLFPSRRQSASSNSMTLTRYATMKELFGRTTALPISSL